MSSNGDSRDIAIESLGRTICTTDIMKEVDVVLGDNDGFGDVRYGYWSTPRLGVASAPHLRLLGRSSSAKVGRHRHIDDEGNSLTIYLRTW